MATKGVLRAAHMPPLIHKFPDQDFDEIKSEVIDWLVAQSEIRSQIFNWARDKGAIVFKDGKWQGALYEPRDV
jgi:hypothetical protein